jgi:hypothetical protein
VSFANGKFGSLTILKEIKPDIFLCACTCGDWIELWRSQLGDGVYTNCRKCLPPSRWLRTKDNSAHTRVFFNRDGQRKFRRTAELGTYLSMLSRCRCKTNSHYESYGGRGIRVCDRWLTHPGTRSGQGFKNFCADMGPRPSDKSLDRIDVQGHYEPTNCRWADSDTQFRNQRRWLYPDGNEPPVESYRVMEARIEEEYAEAHPY